MAGEISIIFSGLIMLRALQGNPAYIDIVKAPGHTARVEVGKELYDNVSKLSITSLPGGYVKSISGFAVPNVNSVVKGDHLEVNLDNVIEFSLSGGRIEGAGSTAACSFKDGSASEFWQAFLWKGSLPSDAAFQITYKKGGKDVTTTVKLAGVTWARITNNAASPSADHVTMYSYALRNVTSTEVPVCEMSSSFKSNDVRKRGILKSDNPITCPPMLLQ